MMMMMMVVEFVWEIEKENHDRKHSTAQKINHTQKKIMHLSQPKQPPPLPSLENVTHQPTRKVLFKEAYNSSLACIVSL